MKQTIGLEWGLIAFLVLAALVSLAAASMARDSVTIDGDEDLTAANGVTRGNGTEEDPYIIEGLDINGTENQCILINNTHSHIVIQGMNLSSWNRTYRGIHLERVSNITIRDMTFYNLSVDLEARWCTNIAVENVSSLRGRLEFSWSDGIRVDNYHQGWFYAGTTMASIIIYESANASVTNCTFVGSYQAVRLSDADHVRVTDNTMRDVREGISSDSRLMDPNLDVVIEGNTIDNFTSTAINLQYMDGLGLANNTIRGQGYYYSIAVFGRDLWYIRDNTMEHGGIRLGYRLPEEGVQDFRNNLLAGREIYYFKDERGRSIPLDTHQVILFNCSDCSFTGPFVDPYRPIINVFASFNITLRDFTFAGEQYDLIASLVDVLTVEDCTFSGYRYGLWITDSTDITVQRCDFRDCLSGVIIDDCTRTSVRECRFTGCGAGIGEDYLTVYRPGDYLSIENNTLEDCRDGISVKYVNHASIAGNNFANITDQGIFIELLSDQYPSTNVTIEENTFVDCRVGMELWKMKDLTVRGNVVEASDVGVRIVYSEDGTVSLNRISNCTSKAMELMMYSKRFLLTANVLMNSYMYGLTLDATECRVFLNDFINNTWGYAGLSQAYDAFNNRWDNQKLGNYWDDYEDRYPDATNDGTAWSEPYEVGYRGQAFDNFPLVHPFDLEPPVAHAGVNQTVDEGEHVTLDGTGSRDNRGIVRYEWTFVYDGKHRQLNGPSVGFNFDIPGVYRVDLLVVDATGNEGTATVWVTVLDVLAPSADAGPEVLAEQFTTATLDGSGCHDSAGIANYTWTIDWVGGPRVLHGMLPLVYCGHAGTFNVTLRVTDPAGHWAEDTTVLIVLDREPPVPVVRATYVVDQGRNLRMDAENSTDNVGITRYTWTLGRDGGAETLEGSQVIYAWSTPGNYSCDLTLRDGAGNENSTRFLVTVLDTEPPTIEDPGDVQADMGVLYRFPVLRITDNVEVARITWTFVDLGDTIVLRGSGPAHVFHVPGVYQVALAARDSSGNEAVVRFNLTVVDPDAPVARAGQDRVVPVGTTVTLSGGASSDNDSIVRYLWTFTHGGTDHSLEGETVTFRFTEVGDHEVTLTVWDPSGNSATDTVVVTVLDTLPPKARITVPEKARVGTEVTLSGADSEDNVEVVNWTWTFQHGGTEVVLHGPEVFFVFETAGTYTITLTVRDGSGHENAVAAEIWVMEAGVADGNGEADALDPWQYLIIALLVLVPIVLIVYVLLRRERQGPGDAPSGGPEGGTGKGGEEADMDGWVEFQ